MTTDIMINNVIENICQRFGVAATEIVPRMQAYCMAMHRLGIGISGFFSIILVGITLFIARQTIKINHDWADVMLNCCMTTIMSVVSIGIMILNMVEYIGWKYAPEIKAVEFAANMLKGKR